MIKLSILFFLVLFLGFIFFILCEPFVLRSKSFGYLGINLFLLSVAFAFIVATSIFLISFRFSREISILLSCLGFLIFLGYANLYNIVFPVSLERSFTISIFLRLSKSEDYSIDRTDFFKIEDTQEIYNLRLNEMLDSGLLIEENGRYKLTTKGMRVAMIYSWLNGYLGIK